MSLVDLYEWQQRQEEALAESVERFYCELAAAFIDEFKAHQESAAPMSGPPKT